MSSIGIESKETKRIVRMREVLSRTGLSRTTIYEMIKSGSFNAPIPLGSRAVGWLESDVNKWIDDRTASRRAA
ncbi:helix-turn-helix transcriptional regulator [Caballeronia sordidicola]|uniref:Putative prophage regulatory protein n=1 Tax=Caballeronia sordidicola TaxID=196367 RepID=A0A242MM15_CABSO|nr:AlpA family transcriptional regulator [Caballeronia sordidicola]OTP72365.1 putative prophage regulatory protein [Caballeronia sordidicola]